HGEPVDRFQRLADLRHRQHNDLDAAFATAGLGADLGLVFRLARDGSAAQAATPPSGTLCWLELTMGEIGVRGDGYQVLNALSSSYSTGGAVRYASCSRVETGKRAGASALCADWDTLADSK